jgi:23S rRNA pseudouridine2605 synthase
MTKFVSARRTSPEKNQVTLVRALSKSGAASRTQAYRLIIEGAVAVDGVVEKNSTRWINPQDHIITINGKKIAHTLEYRYVVFHKPAGVVTTRLDERDRETVFDIAGEVVKGLYPVGRLDKDTSGLLLFTNDGRLADLITNPDYHVEKIYLVHTNEEITPQHLDQLVYGVNIRVDGNLFVSKFVHVELVDSKSMRVTLSEGKNRQIRKALEAINLTVKSLCRISIGSLTLDNLKPCETLVLSKPNLITALGLKETSMYRKEKE